MLHEENKHGRMDVNEFQTLVSRLTGEIAGAPLDAALEARLNADFGPGSELYDALLAACQTGVADGWLCNREGGGIRYGRVLKASDATHGYSVDVVDMNDLAGPHHSHPNGEIDLHHAADARAHDSTAIRPGGASMNRAAPHHPPSARAGALVLYLLPQGAIHFTPAA